MSVGLYCPACRLEDETFEKTDSHDGKILILGIERSPTMPSFGMIVLTGEGPDGSLLAFSSKLTRS